jgi:hypothetical protein
MTQCTIQLLYNVRSVARVAELAHHRGIPACSARKKLSVSPGMNKLPYLALRNQILNTPPRVEPRVINFASSVDRGTPAP